MQKEEQKNYEYILNDSEKKIINSRTQGYAHGLGKSIQIQFLNEVQNNAVARVKDDVGISKGSQKSIFINLPSLAKIIHSQTQKYPTLNQLIQISLHELWHLYENAELEYRWTKIFNSSDFQQHFKHTLPSFVAKGFNNLKGFTLLDKRKILVNEEKMYHIFENRMRDVYVNQRSVDYQQWIFALSQTLEDNYRDWCFPGDDWTNEQELGEVMPLHLQFGQGILRQKMTPWYPVILDPKVQSLIDLYNRSRSDIIGCATDISISLPLRLPYIIFLFHKFKELYKEDIQNDTMRNNSKDSSPQDNSQWEQWEWEEQWGQGENEEDLGSQWEWAEVQGEDGERSGASSQSQWESAKGKSQWTQEGDWDPSQSAWNHQQEGEAETDPFAKWYEKINDMPHVLEEEWLKADDIQKLQEEINELIEKKYEEEAKSSSTKKAESQLRKTKYADLENSDPNERDKLVKLLEEYNESILPKIESEYSGVIDVILTDIFENIKSKRTNQRIRNKGPVDSDKGNGELHDTGTVEIYIDKLLGKDITETLARQKDYRKVLEQQLVTGFRFILVCDGSGSMGGVKNRDQKLNSLLIMHALKLLSDKLLDATGGRDNQIDKNKLPDIWSQGLIFDWGSEIQEWKSASNDWTSEDIIQSLEGLSIDNGGTNIGGALQKVYEDFEILSDDYKKKVAQWKEKYIVLVMSDGQTSDKQLATDMIAQLRASGVITSGIGITKDGSPMEALFGKLDSGQGSGIICEKPSDLGSKMQEVLINWLKQI